MPISRLSHQRTSEPQAELNRTKIPSVFFLDKHECFSVGWVSYFLLFIFAVAAGMDASESLVFRAPAGIPAR